MDAVTLDGVLGEVSPLLVGRHLTRVRISGPHAVAFEVSGERSAWLWLEAGRECAGLYRLTRDDARGLQGLAGGEESAAGRTRQALLLLRKHVNGARVRSLRRIAGERVVVIETGSAMMALRLSGAAPALTLVVDGTVLASMGEGPPAWPLPEDAPQNDWDRIDADQVARACLGAGEGSRVRAILSVAPALGPRLARELDGSAESLATLREQLRAARPTLVAPAAVADWTDAALGEGAAALLPFAPARPRARHPSRIVDRRERALSPRAPSRSPLCGRAPPPARRGKAHGTAARQARVPSPGRPRRHVRSRGAPAPGGGAARPPRGTDPGRRGGRGSRSLLPGDEARDPRRPPAVPRPECRAALREGQADRTRSPADRGAHRAYPQRDGTRPALRGGSARHPGDERLQGLAPRGAVTHGRAPR